MSDKIDFKTKSITRYEKVPFIREQKIFPNIKRYISSGR